MDECVVLVIGVRRLVVGREGVRELGMEGGSPARLITEPGIPGLVANECDSGVLATETEVKEDSVEAGDGSNGVQVEILVGVGGWANRDVTCDPR